MSLLSKIFPDMFPQPQQQQQQPMQTRNAAGEIIQTNPQTAATSQTAPNGLIPAGAANPPASPLEQHKDLWEPVKTDPNQANPESATLDPKKIMEAASKIDFSQVLDREALSKISAGGEEAIAAFMGAMNRMAQVTYGQSAIAAQRIIDERLSKAEETFASRLPTVIKNHNAKDQLFAENPAYAHPAVRPMVEMIQSQLAVKYPQASTAELNKMAKELLGNVAGVFNPQTQQSTTKTTKADEDWSDWLPQDPYRM